MGVCCSFGSIDNSLQDGLNENINNNDHAHALRENDVNESSLNTMSVTTSTVADHPIRVDDDDTVINDNDEHGVLNRMHKRKNLKSYLTQVKKSKKQCITKEKKLKELLLDKSNELEYNTAFDSRFEGLSSKTVLPQISFREWITSESILLNNMINELYKYCNIPVEISAIIYCYTLDLLPGIYEFVGVMDYNGTDNDNDHEFIGNGHNECRCEIVLSSRSEIIGGYFRENSLKYYITFGSYSYTHPLYIEFTKEYFNYNYKYKVYGEISRDSQENLQFNGYWKLLNGIRGGNIKMNYVKKEIKNNKLNAGKYIFYGHFNYLPNIIESDKKLLFAFKDRQIIKCFLTLNEIGFKIQGIIKLLNENDNDGILIDMDDDNIFVIDEIESEWDIYGGLHIQLMNGYIMDGFFNGFDFMGVWKDNHFKRFGHFQYQIFHSIDNGNDDH